MTGNKHPNLSRARRRSLLCAGALAMAFGHASWAAQKELERTGGPYVPTPKLVVDEMLRAGQVGPEDFVVDLGSGDGVIVLTAAREKKARGFGVDIDPELVKLSNAEASRHGIADRASFFVEDVFKTDLSKATVITLYLLPSMMIDLRSKILAEARPGTRVVSHDYSFDDWRPDERIELDVPEKEKVTGLPQASILVWTVPAQVAGRWEAQIEGGEVLELQLRQRYQELTGAASAGGRNAPLQATTLNGNDVRFISARRQFTGRVSGDSMTGTVDLGGGRTARWSARRVSSTL